jgi:hypothetical protein
MNPTTTVAALALAVTFGVFAGGRLAAQTAPSTAAAPLPADVYPDSRERLPLPKREDLDDYGKAIFDAQTKPVREEDGRSPASVELYDPKLADIMDKGRHYLKFDTGLGDRLVQIAVLATAREMKNPYEWVQWETVSWEPQTPTYVDPVVVDIVKYEKPVTGIDEKAGAVITFVRELAGCRNVTPATFAHVDKLFGPRLTLDLADLVGMYEDAGAEITAFNLQLKPGQKNDFPDHPVPTACPPGSPV